MLRPSSSHRCSISETHRSKFGPVPTSSPAGPAGADLCPHVLYLGEFRKRLCCLLRLSLLRMEAALLCPVAARTRCEWRACLRRLGGGFFSHSSPSNGARRYFFQVSFTPHFIRGARCWASGCAEHIQGEIFYARTHPTRSPSSSHTCRRPFALASPSHSTRTCAQTSNVAYDGYECVPVAHGYVCVLSAAGASVARHVHVP